MDPYLSLANVGNLGLQTFDSSSSAEQSGVRRLYRSEQTESRTLNQLLQSTSAPSTVFRISILDRCVDIDDTEGCRPLHSAFSASDKHSRDWMLASVRRPDGSTLTQAP